jgi:hypothetical protein
LYFFVAFCILPVVFKGKKDSPNTHSLDAAFNQRPAVEPVYGTALRKAPAYLGAFGKRTLHPNVA